MICGTETCPFSPDFLPGLWSRSDETGRVVQIRADTDNARSGFVPLSDREAESGTNLATLSRRSGRLGKRLSSFREVPSGVARF
jgi:hypothetical protein